MKDMKKREIKKIEDKLSDIEVPDGVLDAARVELLKCDKKPQKKCFKFNYKIALSCAASFLLCLAVILPVSLASFSDNNKDSSTVPPDCSGDDMSPPTESTKYFVLSELEKKQVSGEIMPPAENITFLSFYKYYDGGMEIISENNYTVYGASATVYTLLYDRARVDVLERFENYESEYRAGGVKVSYKLDSAGYLAEAYFNGSRLCFTLEATDKQAFEVLCGYLFE